MIHAIGVGAAPAYPIPQNCETADKPAWRADVLHALAYVAYRNSYRSSDGTRYYYVSGKTDSGHSTYAVMNTAGKVWTENDIPDWDIVAYDYDVRYQEWVDSWWGKDIDVSTFPPIADKDHPWTARYVLDAYNLGFTKGIDEAGTCNPKGEITRAELCQMLYNAGWLKYNCAPKVSLPRLENGEYDWSKKWW